MGMVLATLAILGVALIVGLAANLTLTALLLAFVLVQVFSSYNRARLSAGDEAGRVAAEFQLLGLLPEAYATPAQGALICYARAVTELEWPMLHERLHVAPEPAYWARQLAFTLRRLSEERNGQPFGVIVTTDRDRMDARRRRVLETRTAVPPAVTWLMLGVSGVAVLSIATFTLPIVRRRVQVGALSLLTLVFALVQVAILDIDGKFSGVIRLQPEEMRLISSVLEAQFAGEVPCDADGRPVEGARPGGGPPQPPESS